MQRRKSKVSTPRIRKKTPPGAAPGFTPPPMAGALAAPVLITAIRYNEKFFEERKITDLKELEQFSHSDTCLWLHVEGGADPMLIEQLGKYFRLHRLALEDILNTHQRPKMERYEDNAFMVLRTIQTTELFSSDQLSLFLGDQYVLTVQEGTGDALNPIRDRLRHQNGRLRSAGIGYLSYAIIDAVIDTYFPLLEGMADRLDDLEDRIVHFDRGDWDRVIHDVKRELLMIRRVVWSHRDMVYSLIREAPPQYDAETSLYLRDCYDHTLQQLELVETYRDVAHNLMDLSFSLANLKSNEVMKVLTIVASIFIPLTFITSIYGMNFDSALSPWNMPELTWRYGYIFVWLVMLSLAGSMIYVFRRKGWF